MGSAFIICQTAALALYSRIRLNIRMRPEDKKQFKQQLFAQFARIGKAVGSGARLELLELLAQGERPVEELAAECGLTVANASQHLQVLRRAHLVAVRKQGTFSFYRLASPAVFAFWLGLRKVAEDQLAEVRQLVNDYLQDRTELEAINARQLRQRMKEGTVTVIDVRPVAEYAAGHVPGARSIPLRQLADRLRELPKNQIIVAYCRGPYCLLADEAAALLAKQGYATLRFEGGFPEWKAAGGKVMTAKNADSRPA